MKKIKGFLFGLVLALLPSLAMAQGALTPACSNPPPNYNVVWTSGQWIACLSSFQAFLGYTPLNQAGGTMSGPLGLAPSLTSAAPLFFQIGVAPTSPNNGDLWFTSSGLFYRAGGVSIGPLASTTSPSFSDPTFTGTVTFPDASTWTSAGSQNAKHVWVNRATDAGGAQVLQVQGAGYFSGGVSVGTTTAETGGFVVNNALSASVASSISVDYSSGGRVISYGASNSTYSTLSFLQQHSDASGSRVVLNFDSSGNAQFSGTTSLGTGSTDYVTAAGGASGGTVSTNAGTLTVFSGGGATTKLTDTAVQLSAAGYHTCSLLGTDGSGNITCGGAPSGYITYNDNVTTNVSPAVTGNLYCMNTGSGALTITLPASPANGDYVAFEDCGGNFAIHNLTIANNGNNLMYNAGSMIVSTNYVGAVVRYSLGKTSWILSPL